jgi:hypothetical protein
MPVGNLLEDIHAQPFPEFHHPFLMAGGAEMTPLAGEGQEVIRGRSLCISHGQTRCGCRRNPDTDKSPAGRKVARIRTVLRNVHHRFEQKFQNSPLSNLPY